MLKKLKNFSLYNLIMISLIVGILARIISNSYLNVFQKTLTNRAEHPTIINFYTYLGLLILSFGVCQNIEPTFEIIKYSIFMGLSGALGNYFIIKALSSGELSTLAPINSYKPVVALVFGYFLLNETPGIIQLFGIGLIIAGTFLLGSGKVLYNRATFYRFLALIFSGTEAIFIKKIIILTDITSAFFLWALAGFIFAILFAIISKHRIRIKRENFIIQIALILMVALMQYSTNYVFAKMNVAYALALFQLSTVLSVFLGVNIFKESGFLRKLAASIIMLIGAVIIIL